MNNIKNQDLFLADPVVLNLDEASENALELPTVDDVTHIKSLLRKIFKEWVDCEEIASLILNGEIKTLVNREIVEGDTDSNFHGFLCFIPLAGSTLELKDKKCITQLKTLLTCTLEKHKSDSLKDCLGVTQKEIGIILSEFLTHPSLPVQERFLEYLEKKDEQLSQKYEVLIFICKCEKMKTTLPYERSSEEIIVWNNPEEEILTNMADFEISICMEEENTNSNDKTFSSDPWSVPVEFRKIIFVHTSKLDMVKKGFNSFHQLGWDV